MSFLTLPAKRQRLVTGVILLIVLILSLYYGGLFLRLTALAAALLGLYEFFNLFWPGRQCLGLKLGGAICAGVAIVGHSPVWTAVAVAGAFCFAALAFLRDYGTGDESARLPEYAPLVFGVLYVPFMLQLALSLSTVEQVLVIAAAALTDTGGYYAGGAFGKRKIWPSVSPKKTWEGSAGGMICCTAFCIVAGVYGAEHPLGAALPKCSLPAWLLIGIFLNLASQFGDFFESALKRSAGVKDSGNLLPGHGGILDRLDSILFAIPAYMLARALAEGVV